MSKTRPPGDGEVGALETEFRLLAAVSAKTRSHHRRLASTMVELVEAGREATVWTTVAGYRAASVQGHDLAAAVAAARTCAVVLSPRTDPEGPSGPGEATPP